MAAASASPPTRPALMLMMRQAPASRAWRAIRADRMLSSRHSAVFSSACRRTWSSRSSSASERYYAEDIAEPLFKLNLDSTIEVPEGPGLGVQVVQAALQRATLRRELMRAG